MPEANPETLQVAITAFDAFQAGMGSGDVFEVRSQGSMLGHPYENQAAIAFGVSHGKISTYREYLGVIFQLRPS